VLIRRCILEAFTSESSKLDLLLSESILKIIFSWITTRILEDGLKKTMLD